MSRLLILSCSEKKRPTTSKCPAINLYDGPAYRVLMAYRERVPTMGDAGLRVMVLSAEHGLIGGWDHIATYDRKMTTARAAELMRSTSTRKAFDAAMTEADQSGSPVFSFAGAAYRNLLSEMQCRWEKAPKPYAAPSPRASIEFAGGSGIGDMLAHLKHWLEAGTLTHSKRADAIAREIDALERKYDGAMPDDDARRIVWLEDELAAALKLARASD